MARRGLSQINLVEQFRKILAVGRAGYVLLLGRRGRPDVNWFATSGTFDRLSRPFGLGCQTLAAGTAHRDALGNGALAGLCLGCRNLE